MLYTYTQRHKQCVHPYTDYITILPNFHRICKTLYTKTKKGKQHTGVLWIYLELNKHRTTSDSPYLDITSMMTLKTFERYFIEVRIETQYIDVIFRQVMEIC